MSLPQRDGPEEQSASEGKRGGDAPNSQKPVRNPISLSVKHLERLPLAQDLKR
jgi:hypothetical protein